MQIVESVRKGGKITQKIVRHVGVAMDDAEMEELQRLAECIRLKIEAESIPFLFPPEDVAREPGKPKNISADDLSRFRGPLQNCRQKGVLHEPFQLLLSTGQYLTTI